MTNKTIVTYKLTNDKTIVTYKLTDEEVAEVQRVYNDLIAHRAIISEVISSNPSIDINNTLAYSQFKKLMIQYDKTTSDIIYSKSAKKMDEISSWKIDFEQNILTITR